MRRLSVRNSSLRDAGKVTLFAAIVGLTLLPRETLAQRRPICPLWVADYCVLEPDGQISTVSTNPCWAKINHLKILYAGSCKVIWHGPAQCVTPECLKAHP
jgi:hypothetical protein